MKKIQVLALILVQNDSELKLHLVTYINLISGSFSLGMLRVIFLKT